MNLIKATISVLACAAASSAMSAEMTSLEIAEAVKTAVAAEKSVYDKLIVARAKQHGCAVSDNYEKSKSLIPPTARFQDAVMTYVKTRDGAKYKKFFDDGQSGSLSMQDASDILHAYVDSSRTTYTKIVINNAIESKCGIPSEQWADEKGLPLPAQFTRAVADGVRKAGKFMYSLQSEWPINHQNTPKTDFEKAGMKSVQNRKPNYGEETLASKRYASAAYPDVAVTNACVTCHNEHKESAKKDFKVGDVMGAMILRIPLK